MRVLLKKNIAVYGSYDMRGKDITMMSLGRRMIGKKKSLKIKENRRENWVRHEHSRRCLSLGHTSSSSYSRACLSFSLYSLFASVPRARLRVCSFFSCRFVSFI